MIKKPKIQEGKKGLRLNLASVREWIQWNQTMNRVKSAGSWRPANVQTSHQEQRQRVIHRDNKHKASCLIMVVMPLQFLICPTYQLFGDGASCLGTMHKEKYGAHRQQVWRPGTIHTKKCGAHKNRYSALSEHPKKPADNLLMGPVYRKVVGRSGGVCK